MDRKGSCEVCKNDIIISKKCDYSILGRKGIDGINKARIEINPENPCVIVYNGNCKHYVHIACRKTYTDPRRLTKVISKHKLANEPCSQPQLRSDATLFSFKRDCLMCDFVILQRFSLHLIMKLIFHLLMKQSACKHNTIIAITTNFFYPSYYCSTCF